MASQIINFYRMIKTKIVNNPETDTRIINLIHHNIEKRGALIKRKKKILIGSSIFLGAIVLVVSLLYLYGFSISIPEYKVQYFTSEYLDKYSSAEKTFDHFVKSITKGDKSYYQEVLGRMMTDKEIKEFKSYSGKEPRIIKIAQNENHAYLVTDNNWGEHFEKVKGRWVFTPEDWGVIVRDAFK